MGCSMNPDAVDSFLRARAGRPAWIGVPPEHRPRSEAEGYHLQAAVHDRLVAAGARQVGYKVGSTSPSGQSALGLSEPIYAGIFDTTRRASLSDALSIGMVAPLVECEVALFLGADIDGTWPGLTLSNVVEAIDSCHLACEVVDNRYGDPLAVGVPTLLVDDFFHVSFVLGPPVSDWRGLNLTGLEAEVAVDGALFTGNTASVLTPLQSLAWLARKLTAVGMRLRAGQIILTGAIVPPVPITALPRSLSLSIAGFGRMDLTNGG
jgi:2-keto-4-pentenoate hydratase